MDFGGINPVIADRNADGHIGADPAGRPGRGGGRTLGRAEPGRRGHDDHRRLGGFVTAVQTGSPVLGFVGGALAGAVLSLIFALLTQVFLANQVATGLALTLFGLGVSSLGGQGYNGIKPPATGKPLLPSDRWRPAGGGADPLRP
jgi:hypothetical protein